MSIRLTDTQRQAAIEQAGHNTVLTSGAGCGKTAVLTQRFFELLRRSMDGDSGGIDGLVALTFTEKAALQMRQRLAELLATLAADSSGPQRAALHTWLDQLPEARISTIHSFAASLVRTHALTAGVDPAFAVLADDLQARQMADEAVEKAIVSAVEADDEPAARLLSRGGAIAVADEPRPAGRPRAPVARPTDDVSGSQLRERRRDCGALAGVVGGRPSGRMAAHGERCGVDGRTRAAGRGSLQRPDRQAGCLAGR
ncbi:MAG: UvrD-helicase domain-containing protein, partial [Planctomycetota bacterium]